MSKPRVFVTTDIGGYDNDDDQSMVHLLLYADKLDIKGLGASAPGPGRASDIHQVIDAYAKDFGTLRTHSGDYPTPEALRAVVHQGAVDHQPAAGFSNATAASNSIIANARAGSEADPLYVLTWGAIGDVAQALHDAPDIASKIRIISIGVDQQDPNAGRYMMENWKGEVWWIDNQTSFRGMYAPENGMNEPLAGWVGPNATGHGALAEHFVEHSKGLHWQSGASASNLGIKMGDTPSLLYLLDQADNNNPAADSWGGDFVQTAPLYWTDNPSGSLAFGSYKGARTVAEDRGAFMADFAARLDRAKAPAAGSAPDPEAGPARPTPTPEAPPAPVPVPVPSGDGIGLGLTELDTLSLSGFTLETHSRASSGEWLKTAGTGRATGSFEGPDGTYKMTVGFMDENDGNSPMSVSVNGKVVSSWSASADTNQVRSHSLTLALDAGDTIAVGGTAHWGEAARMDWIRIEPTAGGGAAPGPAPTPAPTPAPGSSPGNTDTIVLRVSEDAWHGDALFTVKVDGALVGGVRTATASRAAGETQDVVLTGNWAEGRHKLSVDFLNDAWGGTSTTDRNLYVEDILVNGQAQSGDQAALMTHGSASFDVLIA